MGKTAEQKEHLQKRIELAERHEEKFKQLKIDLKSQLHLLNKVSNVEVKVMPSKKCFALGTQVFFKIVRLTKLGVSNIWVEYIEVSLKNNHIMRKSVQWDKLKLHSSSYRPIAEVDYQCAFGCVMRNIHEGLYT